MITRILLVRYYWLMKWPVFSWWNSLLGLRICLSLGARIDRLWVRIECYVAGEQVEKGFRRKMVNQGSKDKDMRVCWNLCNSGCVEPWTLLVCRGGGTFMAERRLCDKNLLLWLGRGQFTMWQHGREQKVNMTIYESAADTWPGSGSH